VELPKTLFPGLNGYYGDGPRDQGDIYLGIDYAIGRGYGAHGTSDLGY